MYSLKGKRKMKKQGNRKNKISTKNYMSNLTVNVTETEMKTIIEIIDRVTLPLFKKQKLKISLLDIEYLITLRRKYNLKLREVLCKTEF